jgi:hypothetical protein
MSLTKLPGFTLDTTSNATFANLTVTGNLTAGNANLGNLAIANYFSGSGNLLSNIQVANVTGIGNIATVNKDGNASNILYGNGVFSAPPAVSSYGNSNVATFLGSYGSNTISTTGNITAGNIIGIIAAGSNTITTTGNANVGNLGFGSGVITGTGNITAGNANLGNATTANYFIGNLYGNANLATYATTANAVAGANVSGQVTYAATANAVAGANVSGAVSYASVANSVAGANVSGTVSSATTAGTVTTAAQPNITSVGTLSSLSVTGDIGAANLVLSGNLTVSGTTTTVNSTTTRVVDPILEQGGGANGATLSSNDSKDRGTLLHYYTGSTATDAFMGWDNSNAEFAFGSNVTIASEVATFNSFGNVRANVYFGNGSQLTGISTSYAIANGTSNINIPTVNGNINLSSAGNANIAVITGTGVNVAGYVNATGNVTGNYIKGNGYYLTGVDQLLVGGADVANYIANGTSNVNTPIANGNITVSIGGVSNTVVFTGTGINVAGTITATGNISAGSNYVLGNGFYLTGVDTAGRISSGTSNVGIPTANGNVTVGVGGTGNVVVISTLGVNIAGYANLGTGNLITTGNITGGNANLGNAVTANYVLGNGYYLTGISTSTSLVNGTSNVLVASGGNVSMSVGGTTNVAVVTGTGVNVSGTLTTTGNISAGSNYFVGNGYYLTGLDAAGRVVNGTSNLSIAVASGNITFGVGGTGNVVVVTSTGIVVPGSGTIYANSGVISAGTLYGTLATGNQYNVTHLGTLDNLTVTGNANVGNINTGGNVYANSGIVKGQYLYGDGSNLTGLGGAGYIFNGLSNVYIPSANSNVYFTVGTSANVITVTGTGINVAGYANLGSGNLTTTGNITAGNANLGNSAVANYFTGNLYGNANTAGTVTASSQSNITSVGTLTGLTVSGITNLGAVGNITITGGAADYYLKTDGTGNLSWSAVTGGGGGGSITYTSDTTPPATGNLLGDQWFNTTTSVLYEYISDGTASYWVDISGATNTTSVPTTLNLANITISGGTNGQVLVSNGGGGLSFANISTSSISNGNSNISVIANGNITLSAIGTSNVLVISNTGIIVTGTANLGSASNLRLSGGTNNQVLTSNGAGGASWQEPQNTIHPFLLMGA